MYGDIPIPPRHGLAGMVKIKILPQVVKPRVVGFVFLPQVLNGNIAMSDKSGILMIPTSPQMRIIIPIFHVKMKYFDLFSTLLNK